MTHVPANPNSDQVEWPDPDDPSNRNQQVFEGKVHVRGKRIEATIARAQAIRNADLVRDSDFGNALMDLAKAGIDRARSNAETVQKAAGAIGTLYVGVVGVAFSLTSRPLPARGVLPALFLGIAVALSTGYLAYMSRNESAETLEVPEFENGIDGRMTQVGFIVDWVTGAVRQRAGWLRGSVVALAIGVILLPLPFLAVVEANPRAVPTWPAPSPGAIIELEKIRYGAEVAEVAKQRDALTTAAQGNDIPLVVALTLVGMILVGLAWRQKKQDVPS